MTQEEKIVCDIMDMLKQEHEIEIAKLTDNIEEGWCAEIPPIDEWAYFDNNDYTLWGDRIETKQRQYAKEMGYIDDIITIESLRQIIPFKDAKDIRWSVTQEIAIPCFINGRNYLHTHKVIIAKAFMNGTTYVVCENLQALCGLILMGRSKA